jgi:DNA-binding Lrp family transcriptional regulator
MTLAFVFIECARGLVSSAEQAVRQVQGVLETHAVKSGTDYDLLLKVQAEDEKQLKTTVTALKSIAGIAAVAVSIVYGSTQ